MLVKVGWFFIDSNNKNINNMDKQLAFILVAFFIFCASIITVSTFRLPQTDITGKWISIFWAIFTWVCIALLAILVIIYK